MSTASLSLFLAHCPNQRIDRIMPCNAYFLAGCEETIFDLYTIDQLNVWDHK